MLKIDIDMPKSCSECIFRDIIGCPFVAGVPSWQNEIAKCTDKRSEHCTLIEDSENDFIKWITDAVFEDDWCEDNAFYQEVILRKLVKLGTVRVDGDMYVKEPK